MIGDLLHESHVALIDGEGQFPENQLEQNDPQRPQVTLFVIGFPFEDLRSHGDWCSAVGLHHDLFSCLFFGKAEVCQLDGEVFFDQNIGQLQVSMSNTFGVNVHDSLADTLHYFPYVFEG